MSLSIFIVLILLRIQLFKIVKIKEYWIMKKKVPANINKRSISKCPNITGEQYVLFYIEI